MQHAADRLQKEAGLSEVGAAALVARWAGVEAADGPGSVNRKSGAFGIAQWLGARLPGIAGNTDFDAQLGHAIGELNGSEKAAGDMLRTARTPDEGATGASAYERAEGSRWMYPRDLFTGKAPVGSVLDALHGKGAANDFIIGDSIAAGLRAADGNAPGSAKVGESPAGVLARIAGLSKGDLTGKRVILSTGASNNPAQIGLVEEQLKALTALGVDPKNVRIVGVGNRLDFSGINEHLQGVAKSYGAQFAPLGSVGPDHVHPSADGYRRLLNGIPGLSGLPGSAGVPLSSLQLNHHVSTSANSTLTHFHGGINITVPPNTDPHGLGSYIQQALERYGFAMSFQSGQV